MSSTVSGKYGKKKEVERFGRAQEVCCSLLLRCGDETSGFTQGFFASADVTTRNQKGLDTKRMVTNLVEISQSLKHARAMNDLWMSAGEWWILVSTPWVT